MRAVIYLRVSTCEQVEKGEGEEGFSIPAQREACVRHVGAQGWELVDEYVDRGESARSADRPALQQMLQRIAEQSDVDAVVVHKVDRLARNLEDHVAIRALFRRRNVALVSVSENLEETASGRLVEGIHALMAEFYSANLANEIKKGMGEKAKQGGYPHRAPLGYLNVREVVGGRQVARIVPDPERAALVSEVFELYVTGEWTIERLAAEMAHRGLVNRGRADYPQKPLGVSAVASLLANPAYTGVVEWNGVRYPGTHEPLVSPATFQRVQELLQARAMRGTRERRHHHYLKGLLVCGVCGRRLSIQRSKNSYTYFYCLGQKDRRHPTGCRESYVATDALEAEIEDLYRRVEVPSDWADGLMGAVSAEVEQLSTTNRAERASLSRRRERIETDRRKLLDAYYANAIDVTMLRAEQDRLGADLRTIDDRLAKLDASLEDWQDVIGTALRFATSCAGTYQRADNRTRKLFNSAVLESVRVREGHVTEAKYQEPFDVLFGAPKFEYGDVVEVSGLEPPTSTLRR